MRRRANFPEGCCAERKDDLAGEFRTDEPLCATSDHRTMLVSTPSHPAAKDLDRELTLRRTYRGSRDDSAPDYVLEVSMREIESHF